MTPYLFVLNLLIIVFGGSGRRGCLSGSGCLFWIVVSVIVTVLINLVLLLFSMLFSGPNPGAGGSF
jgi:hypothetical protein